MPQRKKTPRQSAGKIVAEAIKRDKALSALLEPDALSPSGARRAINKLEVSEEWRKRLRKVVRLAVQAGGRVYQVGLKIIETIVDLKKRYPDTSATLLAGGVLTLLASWIPVLGGALAPL